VAPHPAPAAPPVPAGPDGRVADGAERVRRGEAAFEALTQQPKVLARAPPRRSAAA
jgi:hypothetical protein